MLTQKIQLMFQQTTKTVMREKTQKKNVSKVIKGNRAFSLFGNVNAGNFIDVTVNKTDDFVSYMVYSMVNGLKVHDFLKRKDISKDAKECFEHKIKDKKCKERLSDSFLEECLEAARNDVENGKWPPTKTKLKFGLLTKE